MEDRSRRGSHSAAVCTVTCTFRSSSWSNASVHRFLALESSSVRCTLTWSEDCCFCMYYCFHSANPFRVPLPRSWPVFRFSSSVSTALSRMTRSPSHPNISTFFLSTMLFLIDGFCGGGCGLALLWSRFFGTVGLFPICFLFSFFNRILSSFFCFSFWVLSSSPEACAFNMSDNLLRSASPALVTVLSTLFCLLIALYCCLTLMSLRVIRPLPNSALSFSFFSCFLFMMSLYSASLISFFCRSCVYFDYFGFAGAGGSRVFTGSGGAGGVSLAARFAAGLVAFFGSGGDGFFGAAAVAFVSSVSVSFAGNGVLRST